MKEEEEEEKEEKDMTASISWVSTN